MFAYLKILKINSTNYKEILTKLLKDVDNLFILDRPSINENCTLLIGVDLSSGIKFNAELFNDEDRLYIYAQNNHDLTIVSKTIKRVLNLH